MKIEIEIPDRHSEEVQTAVENIKTESEIQKLNAVCFWLIKMCSDTNSETATISQDKVHRGEKQLGDWIITVKKKQ